ncbi:hypothetical protein [Maricaulis sp.]|uniref:hypothetical protein n=1 Tax=Maricaulis sp. TaxID=1486257 RepID=UPI003A916047
MIDAKRADETIRVDTAFETMRAFLRAFWERGDIDDPVRGLLSSTEPTANGMPIDRAQWQDFLDALDRVKKSGLH